MRYWKYIFIALVLFVGGFLYAKYTPQHTQNQSNSMKYTQQMQAVISEYAPTPTTSFSMKQACIQDANTFVANMQQNDDNGWKTASQYHTGNTNDTLKGAAYSQALNTCVVEIETDVTEDSSLYRTTKIYDATNPNKVLAQCGIASNGSCDNSSFTDWLSLPLSVKKQDMQKGDAEFSVNWADWKDYENAVGL